MVKVVQHTHVKRQGTGKLLTGFTILIFPYLCKKPDSMAFNGLTDFVSFLESRGDLARVTCSVNPELEVTEIADRMVKSGGQALLFEDTGTNFPILINAFASDSRIAAAIGRKSLEEAGADIISLFDSLGSNKGWKQKMKNLPGMLRLVNLGPKRKRGKGECQEVIDRNPDLNKLPVLKCWPHDGGRFITLPLVHTRHPLTGKTNLGMYRMQIMGPDKTGMHWHRHKTGARQYEAWKNTGQRMPVTVSLGGDPVYTYSATAPLPEGIDEYLLAGFLRKKRVRLVKCITNDLWVPSDSDIVIEGYVDTGEGLVTEGPFGDHTGFYSLADKYPLFHVTCITYRRDAVYPATIVGVPPMEDAWFGKATEKIFLAPMKLALAPEIKDMHMPVAGVNHNLVLVSINKSYPGQGMKVLNSLFGAGQMMFSKYIIVVSSEVRLDNYHDVAEAVLRNTRFEKDLLLMHGPLDVLDHSSDTFSMGGKMGIDATVKMEEEKGAAGRRHEHTEIKREVNKDGIITGTRQIPGFAAPVYIIRVEKPESGFDMKNLPAMIPEEMKNERALIMAVDNGADASDIFLILWMVLGNTDPLRDFYNLPGGGLLIDATSKVRSVPSFPREWPNVVCSDIETIKLVDSRWDGYKTGTPVPSPSLKLLTLLHSDGASAKRDLR